MAEELLIPGSASDVEDFVVAPDRALRADTSNHELRLHDGAKIGGWRIKNSDQNDDAYQARSVELDGLSFGPQLRGFLTRTGPAQYRLRQFTVNEDNLTLSNPRGLAGDPLFSLAPIILSAHEWDGVQTFVQAIDAAGGLDGETRGLHVGGSEGTHSGPTVGLHTGDVDIRGSDFLVDDGQITLPMLASTITDQFISRGLPLGAIILWAGTEDNIPESFQLCDGTGGTPDLRNRFIVGAGDDYEAGDTGGADSHTHGGTATAGGAHSHALTIEPHILITAEMPEHQHPSGINDVPGGGTVYGYGEVIAANPTPQSLSSNGADGTADGLTGPVGGGGAHGHAGSVSAADGAHTHDVEGAAGDSRPRYYALCYIMKMV